MGEGLLGLFRGKCFVGEGPFCKRVASPTPPPPKTFILVSACSTELLPTRGWGNRNRINKPAHCLKGKNTKQHPHVNTLPLQQSPLPPEATGPRPPCQRTRASPPIRQPTAAASIRQSLRQLNRASASTRGKMPPKPPKYENKYINKIHTCITWLFTLLSSEYHIRQRSTLPILFRISRTPCHSFCRFNANKLNN